MREGGFLHYRETTETTGRHATRSGKHTICFEVQVVSTRCNQAKSAAAVVAEMDGFYAWETMDRDRRHWKNSRQEGWQGGAVEASGKTRELGQSDKCEAA